MQILPDTTFYPVQIIYLIVGIVLVALGIFIYIPANLFPQPYDGLTRIIANKTVKFPTVKMYFDITHVIVSALLCFILLGNLGSVREGTILAAFGVGWMINYFINMFGKYIYQFMGRPAELTK